MSRYIVTGAVTEGCAYIHCTESTEEEALERWEEAFPSCPRDAFLTEAMNIDEMPSLRPHWKGEGYHFCSTSGKRGR